MKTAIVTGATGFIGERLVHALTLRGVMITALTRRATGRLPGVDRAQVMEDANLCSLCEETDPDVVFHLAGISGEAVARRRPALAMEANARLVWTMLEAIHRSGRRPAVVVASSVAVYGGFLERPAREDDALRGGGAYELSKIAGECAARAFAELGVDVRIARIGNVFGPGDPNAARLIPSTLEAIRKNRPLVLRSPESVRSYLHVDDCAAGLIALGGANGAALAGRAVNICSERGISNIDLVRLILTNAGRKDLLAETALGASPSSIRLTSAALAAQVLDWAPEITLEHGLAELLERLAA
jgi:UDP-glucose 4-epimerase